MNLDGTCILLLLTTLNKKVLQVYFFSSSLYTVFSNIEKDLILIEIIEKISRDESGSMIQADKDCH